jgi:hypothetical protein
MGLILLCPHYHGLTVRASASDVEQLMNALVQKVLGTEGLMVWVRERITVRGVP